MRTHGDYGLVQLWPDRERGRRLVRADALAAIRFELVERDGVAAGWIDLTFSAGGEVHVVPGVLAEPALVVAYEPGALIWPRSVAIAGLAIEPLADRVLAHVNALLRGRLIPGERTIELVECAAFRAARERGDLGASPLGPALARMAPWVYAGRAMAGRTARAGGSDAALGAAVLRSFGVAVEFSSEAPAADWYAVASARLAEPPGLIVDDDGGTQNSAAFQIALRRASDPGWREIPVTLPRPMDVAVAFDAGDDRSGVFWVRDPSAAGSSRAPQPAPRTEPAGPRLALVARGDLHANADTDTDQIAAIAEGMRELGARVDVTSYADEVRDADLTVAFGDLTDPAFRQALHRAAERNRPFVVAPEPVPPYAAWHEAAPAKLLAPWNDDEYVTGLSRAYDAGTLDISGVTHDAPGTDEPGKQVVPALARASALLMSPIDDPALLAPFLGSADVLQVPVMPILPVRESDAASPFGPRPFAFAHGEGSPRSGLLALALAVRELDVPIAIAATGANPQFVAMLRRAAGPHTTVFIDPPAALVAALYRNAVMFADLSLRPRGPGRLLRALRSGALPVVVANSPLAPFFRPADLIPRLALESVRDTVFRLWHSPLREPRAAALGRAAEALQGGNEPLAALRQAFATFAPGFAFT